MTELYLGNDFALKVNHKFKVFHIYQNGLVQIGDVNDSDKIITNEPDNMILNRLATLVSKGYIETGRGE